MRSGHVRVSWSCPYVIEVGQVIIETLDGTFEFSFSSLCALEKQLEVSIKVGTSLQRIFMVVSKKAMIGFRGIQSHHETFTL